MHRIGGDSPTIYWAAVAKEFNKLSGKRYTGLNCREYSIDTYKPCPRCSRVQLDQAIRIINSKRLAKGLTIHGQEGNLTR